MSQAQSQNNSAPTFLADDGPLPTSFIQTGKELRLGYALRKESLFITTILIDRQANPGDPTDEFENYSDKTWQSIREGWKREAEAAYPLDGDYIVHLIDDTGAPVPTGSLVEYIGATSPITEGASPCIEYTWDLTGVTPGPDPLKPIDPLTTFATLTYRDCYNVEQNISELIVDLGTGLNVCMLQGSSVMSIGTLVEIAPCDLNYKQCTLYFLDLAGVPPMDPVVVNFVDCDGLGTGISGSAGTIQTYFCAERDAITTSVGTLVLQETCNGGTPPIIL
jgi:hypothetical protein